MDRGKYRFNRVETLNHAYTFFGEQSNKLSYQPSQNFESINLAK